MDKVGVFVIDPPWQRKKGGLRKVRKRQGRFLDYPTMDIPSIFSLLDREIFPLAEEEHCVFLWTIDACLPASEREMRERGYRLHCRMIWDKGNGVAPAFTVRYSHEYLLWYYRPRLPGISRECRGKFTTVFSEKSRQHSRKPDICYEMIGRLYPDCVKMDVFSREHRAGWLQYGNQTDYFNEPRKRKEK